MKPVRTRFAPSPTGFLHVGSLRTALYSYAWAKKHQGTFILRVEDTDRARLVPGAIEQVVRSLAWAGIRPDEGVVDVVDGKEVQVGDKGPYIQSQRLDVYQAMAQQLLKEGKAYYCFCTPQRLTEMRTVQMASKQMPKYDRHCYGLAPAEVQARLAKGEVAVIRFLVPEGGPVAWEDVVFGKVEFARDQMDDFVMMKADGYPTYNFANVVDDRGMEITHVIRAQEFLSSTPKHLLLYEAFGADKPVFAHTSHILGKDKKKLSKRHAAVSVDEYRNLGYLPQALLNFIALLGWTHPEQKELFSMDEFIAAFEISAMHKAGAVFDTDKSLWVNGNYIRLLSDEDFLTAAIPFLQAAGILDKNAKKWPNKQFIQSVLATEKPRIKRLDEVGEAVRFFFETPQYPAAILVWKKADKTTVGPILQDLRVTLAAMASADWSANAVKTVCEQVIANRSCAVGEVFWPLRVALAGKEHSPSPQDIAAVLGQDESLRRVDAAIKLL